MDDFESPGLDSWVQSSPGNWKADSVSALSGRYSLHHVFDNPESGNDMVGIMVPGIKPEAGTVKWEFQIRHGYDPSSSNNWGVFLVSDNQPDEMRPGTNVSGYIIGVNMKGSDDTLRMWKVTKGVLTELISTNINWQNDIGKDTAIDLRVEREKEGCWTITAGPEGQESVIGNACDPAMYEFNWFGIYYEYSSTKDRLLWLDNILIDGVFIRDTMPPVVEEINFSSSVSLDITFSERISTETLDTNNFSLQPVGDKPVIIIPLDNYSARLVFGRELENKNVYTIIIGNLCDNSGNCTTQTSHDIVFAVPEWGDIILSELMIDPEPIVGLPAAEYIELFNAGDFDFDLGSCCLRKGNSIIAIKKYKLERGAHVVLCKESDSLLFSETAFVLPVISFPQLKNSGDFIILQDTAGRTIHGLEYTDKWYKSQLKEDGGWSMEMIDYGYPFSGISNWSASVNSSGGTPGFINSVVSVNPDVDNPKIENVFPIDSTTLSVVFSEPVLTETGKTGDWSLDRAGVIEGLAVDPLKRIYRLIITSLKKGIIYELTAPGLLCDAAGNELVNNCFRFGIPQEAGYNDLVINEVLFDPLPWEKEFVEIYNRSDKVLDASSFVLISVNRHTGDTGKVSLLSEDGRCILPGTYYAISVAGKGLTETYPSAEPDFIFQPVSMPVMPDDEGILLLCKRDLTLVDRLHYSSGMHFDLLFNTEGISLERIDPNRPTHDNANWHSASGVSGWGTPGALNSVTVPDYKSTSGINLSSRKISPDNDGHEDILKVRILFNSGNPLITAQIYNDRGYLVRTLINNLTSGTDATLYWDGSMQNGSVVKEGIYIIFVRAIHPSGKISVWKDVCTVIRD